MGEDVFLMDGTGQRLDGGARVLLLPGINYGTGAEPIQYPSHPPELRRRHFHQHLVRAHFRLNHKPPMLLVAIIQDAIDHDSRTETGQGNDATPVVHRQFPANQPAAVLLVGEWWGGSIAVSFALWSRPFNPLFRYQSTPTSPAAGPRLVKTGADLSH